MTARPGDHVRYCGECGHPATPGAQFCGECGEPLGLPPAADTPRVERQAGRPSRRPTVLAVALAFVLVIAGAGVTSYLLLRGDSSDSDSGDWLAESARYGTPSRVDARAATDRDLSAPLEPKFDAGAYLQLGSFRGDGATVEAERLQGRGIDAFVLDSDGVEELLPGFRVVVAGPLSGSVETRRVQRAADRAGITALERTLTPIATVPKPSDVAGTLGGALDRVGTSDRDDAAVNVTFQIDVDGRAGTVRYDRPRCTSELSLSDTDLGSLLYDETITSGRCADGGTWNLKPNGDGVRATWTVADVDFFVSGDLTLD